VSPLFSTLFCTTNDIVFRLNTPVDELDEQWVAHHNRNPRATSKDWLSAKHASLSSSSLPRPQTPPHDPDTTLIDGDPAWFAETIPSQPSIQRPTSPVLDGRKFSKRKKYTQVDWSFLSTFGDIFRHRVRVSLSHDVPKLGPNILPGRIGCLINYDAATAEGIVKFGEPGTSYRIPLRYLTYGPKLKRDDKLIVIAGEHKGKKVKYSWGNKGLSIKELNGNTLATGLQPDFFEEQTLALCQDGLYY
jgi:hypothetical protein